MNRLIRVPVIVAACVLLSVNSFAEDAPISDVVLLKTFPTLKSEELKKVLFEASIADSQGLYFELHNPFRDRTIAALVVTLSFKKADADKPTVLELLLRTGCGPLQSTFDRQRCFNYEAAKNAGAVITLKEVYCVPDKSTAEH